MGKVWISFVVDKLKSERTKKHNNQRKDHAENLVYFESGYGDEAAKNHEAKTSIRKMLQIGTFRNCAEKTIGNEP